MSIRTMMAAFAAITIGCLSRAADTPLPITNITVNAGSVTLRWEDHGARTDIGDLHLESAGSLAGPWTEVQTLAKSFGSTTVARDADIKFFRLYAEDTPLPPNPGAGVNVGGTFTHKGIEWLVLDEVNGKKLIITTKVYNVTYGSGGGSYPNSGMQWYPVNDWVPYADSSLKNNPVNGMDVLWAAYGGDMKAYAVRPVTLAAESDNNPWTSAVWDSSLTAYYDKCTQPGTPVSDANDTTGLVFPLSLTELWKYQSVPGMTLGAPNQNAAYGKSAWWLRSPGSNPAGICVCYVSSSDWVNTGGQGITLADGLGIRPALWINP